MENLENKVIDVDFTEVAPSEEVVKEKTKKDHLIETFLKAKEEQALFVAVAVLVKGNRVPEIIINHIFNLDTKLEYYKNAYDDNLILKNNNTIGIVGVAYGNLFDDIQEQLM